MDVETIKDISIWSDKVSRETNLGINVIVSRFVTVHKEVKDIEKAKKVVELELQRKTYEGKLYG